MKRKRHHQEITAATGVGGEAILTAICGRAVEHTSLQGHTLGEWVNAKHKLGKGARKATCMSCGKIVIAMPYGDISWKGAARENPGIRGDALFEPCLTPQQQPLPSILGLR